MRLWLVKIRFILFIQCEQVAELTSAARDRKLVWHEWLAVRSHQLGCWSCRQFEKHLQFLSLVATRLAERERAAADERLFMPLALRQRLEQRLLERREDSGN